jgi:hypothetical protein
VIQNCREARIMLLDPYSEGASARAKSILDPNVTPETFEEQILVLQRQFHIECFCFSNALFPVRDIGDMITLSVIFDHLDCSFQRQRT